MLIIYKQISINILSVLNQVTQNTRQKTNKKNHEKYFLLERKKEKKQIPMHTHSVPHPQKQ